MREQANVLADRAYRHQQHGEIGHAIALYRRSIATYPTPEAHTWLGWAYALMDRYDEAIAECEKAIALDPENPTRIKTVRGKGYLFSKHDWN